MILVANLNTFYIFFRFFKTLRFLVSFSTRAHFLNGVFFVANFLNIFPISHLKYLLPDAQIDKRTIQGNSQYDQFVRRELSYKSFTITEYKDKLLVIVKNILTSQNKKIEQSNLYIPEQKIYLNKIKYNYDFKNSYIFKK